MINLRIDSILIIETNAGSYSRNGSWCDEIGIVAAGICDVGVRVGVYRVTEATVGAGFAVECF